MRLDKIPDIFMFREGTDEDSDTNIPIVTTGSVVLGMILRSALIIILLFIFSDYFREMWYLSVFIFWFFVAYPAYRQYNKFNKRMDDFKEETLCGTCRHFNPSGQLCTIYDEHVSRNHIPCNGEAWEPKDNFI
jgi:hypothetical protein